MFAGIITWPCLYLMFSCEFRTVVHSVVIFLFKTHRAVQNGHFMRSYNGLGLQLRRGRMCLQLSAQPAMAQSVRSGAGVQKPRQHITNALFATGRQEEHHVLVWDVWFWGLVVSVYFLFKKGDHHPTPKPLISLHSLLLCNFPKCIDQMFSSAGLVVQKTRNESCEFYCPCSSVPGCCWGVWYRGMVFLTCLVYSSQMVLTAVG